MQRTLLEVAGWARWAALGLIVCAGGTAQGAQFVTSISGSLSSSENSCTQIVFAFSGADCTYGNDRPIPGNPTAWIGPQFNGAYYALGSAGDSVSYIPTSGDARIAPGLTGTFTINDNGTPTVGADDTIAAILSIGAAARNISTGQFARAVERWNALDQVLAATAVTSATANAGGGWDYVIGLQGFPVLICKNGSTTDCFPSPNAPTGIPSLPTFWAGPSSVGIERSATMGGNIGAVTTGTFTSRTCSSSNPTDDCTIHPLLWGGAEDPGFDNLLLQITTDSLGQITSGNAFWTQEYNISALGGGAAINSWQGGQLTFTGIVPIPPAAWFFGSALGLMGVMRRKVTV